MIRIDNISKSYGSRENPAPVLKNVSLEIQDGEFIVILGPSGSGKSTLLNVVSGLERPSGGSVTYGSEDIFQYSESELTEFRRKNVGFVFQRYYPLPNLSVEKNVRMGADLSGNRDYRRMIEAVGLAGAERKLPCELSGGEQQRVAVARALAKMPKALFLDEPTGALDEATGRAVLDCIHKLQAELCFTAVMVTHNANIAETADRVVRMNSGNITELSANVVKKNAYEIGW